MASVLVQTGTVNGSMNGKIASNSNFDFLNSDTTQSVLVGDVGGWCENSSYSVPQAASASSPGSITAKTLNVSGSFTYSLDGEVDPGRPHISIGSR